MKNICPKAAKASLSHLLRSFAYKNPHENVLCSPISLTAVTFELSVFCLNPFLVFQMARNLKAFCALGLFSLFLLVQEGGAYEFTVGGSNGWTIPTDSNALNQWAEKGRFQIGDTLLFVYPADKDVLLLVNKDDYNNCNTATPIAKYTDGHTEFKFSQSGPFYFISGVKDHCLKNEKLLVVVLADRSSKKSASSPPPSAASPPPSAASPPPSAASPPSPAPAAENYPSPSPAPSADETPRKKNGATSVVVSFIGSIGALLGSSLLLVL